ncbi:MAG TPA: hypothetical protein VGF32_28950 [Streptosporangiaceae bacterium]|jgi:hypothetical protein
MTAPDLAEPSDLGRFEPTPYDFGVTDNPEATWADVEPKLDAATAATAAAIERGDLADIYLAAEAEEAVYAQVCTGPCDQLEPEMEIE